MENAIVSSNHHITVRDYLRSPEVVKRFEEALGRNPMPYISSVILAVASSDQLQQCDPKSVAAAALRAALVQLPVDQQLGYAYLVPYGKKATFVIGYKGLVQLAMRTNKYRVIHVMPIYESQEVVEDRDGWHMVRGVKGGEVQGYLAFFEMTNRFRKSLYMTVHEIIDHAKKYSKNYNTPASVWKTNFDAMARKTVLRLLLQRWGYLDPYALTAAEDQAIEDAFDLPEPTAGEITVIEEEPEVPPPTSVQESLIQLGFEGE